MAPAVLFVLFDGIPQLVHLEEPRQGIQFGVILNPIGNTGSYSATVETRDRNTSTNAVPARPDMPISFRPGAPGVLNLKATCKTFNASPGTNTGPDVDGAEFALEMIQFPYRQVFGRIDDDPKIAEVFKPTIGYTLADFKKTFVGNIK